MASILLQKFDGFVFILRGCINNVNKVGLQASGIREANMIYCGLALRLAFKELMLKVRNGRWGLLKIIVHW